MRKIVWREWYNENTVKALTKMGTLPRNEIEISDDEHLDGVEVAVFIANQCNNVDGEQFREGGEIVIMEPTEFAGTYDVTTEYEPYFYASKRGADEE